MSLLVTTVITHIFQGGNPMEFKETWKGLLIILLIGVAAGILNIVFYSLVMNPLLADAKADEVVSSTYAINLFVGWVFFSAWFLSRADDELKKIETAVHRYDREVFLEEAPKVIALSIRILYIIISTLVILSFHIFHMENHFVTYEIQFGVSFLVVITALFLWDLDEPIGGAISVRGVPAEWLIELERRKKAIRNGQHPAPKVEVPAETHTI
jgi:hypothetical protein